MMFISNLYIINTKSGYEPKPPKYREEYIVEFNNVVGLNEYK